jgi:hypothetical protein
MAPNKTMGSLEDVRRKVISELVDLELRVSGRRLTRRKRFARRLRRRASRMAALLNPR